MTVDVASIAPTVLIARASVRSAERISPAFVRVTLQSPDFADLGINGYDTRFKMIFPGPTGELPDIPQQHEDWYAHWMSMPEDTKSPMRTYTVRDVLERGDTRELVVDLVVHEHGPQGPACRWALAAQPGDEIQVIVPHRASAAYGGTEFAPGERTDLLLVADETAVPALARILADLPDGFSGRAFAQVPTSEDILDVPVPPGVDLTWLVRADAGDGDLIAQVRRYLGLSTPDQADVPTESAGDSDSSLDVDVWETARFSSSGEDLDAAPQRIEAGSDLENLYAWIAGESSIVKSLRRSLVAEREVDRAQVAFMGYWRRGVSMRS